MVLSSNLNLNIERLDFLFTLWVECIPNNNKLSIKKEMVTWSFCGTPGTGTRIYTWCMSGLFGAHFLWWNASSTMMRRSWSWLNLLCQSLMTPMERVTLSEEWIRRWEREWEKMREQKLWFLCKRNKKNNKKKKEKCISLSMYIGQKTTFRSSLLIPGGKDSKHLPEDRAE